MDISNMPTRRVSIAAGVCFLLLVFGLQIGLTVHQESLTWDEGNHIFSGNMKWKTHDYGFNPEHPPLMKMLGTLPPLWLPLHVPPDQDRNFENDAYLDGQHMRFANGAEYANMVTVRARLA